MRSNRALDPTRDSMPLQAVISFSSFRRMPSVAVGSARTLCEVCMQYAELNVQEAVLALLGAFEFEGGRPWKRYDFAVMEALHSQGLISDPHGRAESVRLTDEGLSKAKALAEELFGARSNQ